MTLCAAASSISCASCASAKCCKAIALEDRRATGLRSSKAACASPDERAVTLKKIDEIESPDVAAVVEGKQSGNEAGETMPLTMPPGATQPAPGPGTQAADAQHLRPRRLLPWAARWRPPMLLRLRPPSPVAPLVCQRQHGGRPALAVWTLRCKPEPRYTLRSAPPCQAGFPCGCPAGEIRARTRS